MKLIHEKLRKFKRAIVIIMRAATTYAQTSLDEIELNESWDKGTFENKVDGRTLPGQVDSTECN